MEYTVGMGHNDHLWSEGMGHNDHCLRYPEMKQWFCPKCGSRVISEVAQVAWVESPIEAMDESGDCSYGPAKLEGDYHILRYACSCGLSPTLDGQMVDAASSLPLIDDPYDLAKFIRGFCPCEN